MTNFKPGDKVRRVGPTSYDGRIVRGNTYTVDEMDGEELYLVETGDTNWYPDYFELIEEPRAGDTVRVTYEGEYAPAGGAASTLNDGARYYVPKGATIEVIKRKVELPTEPGSTIRYADGGTYLRTNGGKWVNLVTGSVLGHDVMDRDGFEVITNPLLTNG